MPQTDRDSPLLTSETDRREALRLRFDAPEVEQQFRRDHESNARTSRACLLGLGALMMAITPLYDRLLLHPPEGFVSFSRWMQFGLQVPMALLALVLTLHPRLRRYSAPAVLVTVIVVCGGLTAQHVEGVRYGFGVPHDFAGLAIGATFMLGQMRLLYFLPVAAAVVSSVTVAQLQVHHYSSAAIYDSISIWMMFALFATGGYLLEVSARTNWRQSRVLESEAARDPLTGLPNRRHFDSMLLRLLRQAACEKKTVALMLLDVDHFKAYNDRYGHPAGDECLRRIARWLSESMRRPQDFCARIGGEEFAAVWFDAQPQAGRQLAEELRAGIRNLGIPHEGSDSGVTVSASAGYVQTSGPRPEEASARIALEMISRADQALYEAKREGRDRLVDARFPGNATVGLLPTVPL